MPISQPSSPANDTDGRVTRTSMSVAIIDNTVQPVKRRTLADIRDQVAQELAIKATTKAKLVEGVKVGVHFTLSKKDDEQFLLLVATHIEKMELQRLHSEYLFALATTGSPTDMVLSANTLIICGSCEDFVQRAILLANSKFLGRMGRTVNESTVWTATVRNIGTSSYDDLALWDIIQKSVRAPIDPLCPPPGCRSVYQILSDARAKLQRVTPDQAYEELHDPTFPMPVFLVDIRSVAQREIEGGIHGSIMIERNDLEWSFDPRSEARLAIADRYDLKVIIYCQEGHTSSLAAAALHEIGILNATDIIGGYAAWKDAGLPGQINPPATISDRESYMPSEISEP